MREVHPASLCTSDRSIAKRSRLHRQPAPLTWAEADRQHYAEMAAREKLERRTQQKTAPLTWAEADRQYYADMAAREKLKRRSEQRTAPLTWAEADREYYAEMAAREKTREKIEKTALPLPWAEADSERHADRTGMKRNGVTAPEFPVVAGASLLGLELRELAMGVHNIGEAEMMALAEMAGDDVVDALAPHIV